jgi:hypothetical protein
VVGDGLRSILEGADGIVVIGVVVISFDDFVPRP